jgi:hypothetical protein
LGRKKVDIFACRRVCQSDRARLNARVGLGALNAGQAWKMAARWHELVEAHERGPNCSSEMRGGASRLAGGLRPGRLQPQFPVAGIG